MRSCYVRFLPLLAFGSLTILSTGKAMAVDFATVFPSKAVTFLGASSVQVNLVKNYADEVKQITAALPKILTEAESDTAVSAAIDKRNLQAISDFVKAMPLEKTSQTITLEEATSVFNSIESNPIVSDAAALKYDPNRNLGFCFGRAAYVHAELLRRGFDPKGVIKVFAIGKLFFRDSFWDYHMATMVRGSGGTWWVIDGLRPKVLSLNDWMREVALWDRDAANPTLRFYFTDPTKFQAVEGGYNSSRLLDPMYNGYFADLMSWFGSQPAGQKSQSRRRQK